MGNRIIPFKSKGPKPVDPSDGEVSDHGSIGSLQYEIYKRGCIHIFNRDRSMIFKKDCDVFEVLLKKMDFNNMSIGTVSTIPGSGDNDDLKIEVTDSDILLNLEKRTNPTLSKLFALLTKGKKKK